MQKIIYLIFMLLLSSAVSACIIDQLVAETNNGVNWPIEGPTWGQSFVACESGPVWEIAFWPNITTTGLHTLLLLTDSNCDTMWTVTNINLSGGNIIIVDLATGSGDSRTVTSGIDYAFQLIGPAGSNLQINLSWTDPYPAGADRASSCASYGLDWWFRVGINEGLAALPVELTEFKANLIESGTAVELDFETASEINASHFVIEHSIEGVHFQEIGTVNAAGTTSEKQSYHFVDQNPAAGDNYYRLRQVDQDASFEYSAIVQVSVKSEGPIFRIFPNPADGDIQVFFDLPDAKNLNIELYSIEGKLLISKDLSEGVNKVTFDGNDLPPGIYFLKASKNGQTLWVDKVVKQ